MGPKLSMGRSSAQRWSKTRERGMRAWVLRRGVLGWGVSMYLIMSALQMFQAPGDWHHIMLIGLLIWPVSGALWGVAGWATMEWLFRRRLRSDRDH